MRKALCAILAVLLSFWHWSARADDFTKETALADAKLRLILGTCLVLPLGRQHIKPYSEAQRSKYIVSLEKAGIITVRNANNSSGNIWQDLSKMGAGEMGEGDLDIDLAPNVDSSQIEVRFGNQTCLKTGRTLSNIQLVSFNQVEAKGNDFIPRKLIIVEGKYDYEGALNSLYEATAAGLGVKPIEHGKFKTLCFRKEAASCRNDQPDEGSWSGLGSAFVIDRDLYKRIAVRSDCDSISKKPILVATIRWVQIYNLKLAIRNRGIGVVFDFCTEGSSSIDPSRFHSFIRCAVPNRKRKDFASNSFCYRPRG